eukprot:3510978-Amphidinium_carterae.1
MPVELHAHEFQPTSHVIDLAPSRQIWAWTSGCAEVVAITDCQFHALWLHAGENRKVIAGLFGVRWDDGWMRDHSSESPRCS